jgi:hypothetical protein
MTIKLKLDPGYHTWGIWRLDLEDMEGREDPPYYWNNIHRPSRITFKSKNGSKSKCLGGSLRL